MGFWVTKTPEDPVQFGYALDHIGRSLQLSRGRLYQELVQMAHIVLKKNLVRETGGPRQKFINNLELSWGTLNMLPYNGYLVAKLSEQVITVTEDGCCQTLTIHTKYLFSKGIRIHKAVSNTHQYNILVDYRHYFNQ